MSLVLSGNAAHVTTALVATIVGMANNGSGAIRVQTSAPHLFATSDYVHVETITTPIDAYFVITVIDATHFDLDGSTFTGTGTGTATDSSLTPQIQVPTDGDPLSLQLSGMLSALQALCDRTQYLKKEITQRTTLSVFVNSSSTVIVPPWATYMLLLGCGGGGGGGGGMGGDNTANKQYASGGAGAGSPLNPAFGAVLNATAIDVVIGAGGVGGSGSAAGGASDAVAGNQGAATTVAYHDGIFAGQVFAAFRGAAGGGGGSNEVDANTASGNFAPVYTPGGGVGPGASFRNAAASKKSRRAPGPAQLYNIENIGGTLDVPSGNWATRVYTDPVGQMDYCEGGASMAHAGDAGTAAGVSYNGASSNSGWAGGTAGTDGTDDTGYIGGAAGGGGGGGGFGVGGAGGNGGNGSAAGTATAGVAGTAASANTGAGGGGGGGGGNGGVTQGAGAAGGNGGSGAVWIVFLASPTAP